MTLQEHLREIGACDDARAWAGELTAKEAWEQCTRPDWMLWWMGHIEHPPLELIVQLSLIHI